jgi:hypothetical protein
MRRLFNAAPRRPAVQRIWPRGEKRMGKIYSEPTKPNPEIFVKQIPRAIIRWPAGLDAPPVILPQGGSDVLDEQIHEVLIKALKLKATTFA